MSLSNKLFLSRSVILELLQERGLDTSEYENFTQKEIETMYNTVSSKNKDVSQLDLTLKNKNTTIVKYVLSPRIRTSNIINLTQTFVDESLEEGDTLIIIIKDKLTSDEQLEEYFKMIYHTKKIFCQYFWINMLTLNITKHEKVPKHIIMSKEELDKLVKNIQISSLDKLQVIKNTDPVAKYYGMKEGDVCKIIRKSETAGVYLNYRLCQN